MGWIEFFFTHHDRLDQKITSTQPNPTYAHPYFLPFLSLLWLVQNFNCNFLPFLAVFVISSWCVGFWISCNDWQALVMEIVFNSCVWIIAHNVFVERSQWVQLLVLLWIWLSLFLEKCLVWSGKVELEVEWKFCVGWEIWIDNGISDTNGL